MNDADTQVNPSIMSHVSVGTNRMEEACAFYDAVLATVGAGRVLDLPEAVAYGREYPEFWVGPPHDGRTASVGNGVHFAFGAASQAEVDNFYRVALEKGAASDGEPGPRAAYTDAYYGCFVRDLDGNKIEAVFWDAAKAPQHPA